ncbi:hypothetical protein Clacol_003190 [Clathrus columnatus]|uniref:Uncharacterized protein n=1 Tax=Clathrus columnatus TaxID=1419009 RepID=A0AAV5A2T0_9AGAM|nr:hypothetical protein Clacol_003190 [Clathrus columnatus]
MTSSSCPPQYILLSHSNASSSSTTNQINTPPTLSHPIIQYYFRDDPPISLDTSNNAHVLVMDYDPASPDSVYVQSLSSTLAVTSLRITDAPGAANDDDEHKNNNMYVIDTVSRCSDKRNALLRKALDYPLPSESPQLQNNSDTNPEFSKPSSPTTIASPVSK